ncbi:MAG TPA: GH3 auxin-responsive promoter family protein [Rhodospirillales bacterium]|nr:GH3 auxin-responsive promoter family protein [Rhodospirillales bacterium]
MRNGASTPDDGGPGMPRRPRRRQFNGTPLLRVYTRLRARQLATQDAAAAQHRQPLRLLAKAKDTRFGRDHGFARIASVEDFQRAVPLRRWEDLWRDYWQADFPRLTDCTWPGMVPFFAQTSGTTTGITKYIPCTRAMIASNRRAAMDLITHHLVNRPESAVFAGRNFMLGGSTALVELSPGVWSGDLSGIAGRNVPIWARPFYFPPRHLETIADWEEKIAAFAPASLEVDVRVLGGTPSWMLLFLEKLAALDPGAGRRLSAFYPNLEMLVHGGVSFAPYRAAFAEWLQGSRAETREVYPASEGFIAVADRGDGEGLRLICDHGMFFEFVPVEELDSARPTRHWVGNIELGVNYAIVLSTCAGLWGYVVGDTVRFVERDPPRLLITGRTSYSLSAFGEHLIGEELEQGIAAAAEAVDADVADWSAGALYPSRSDELGGHIFLVEFAGGAPEAQRLARFAAVLDATLAELNDDYRVHRSKGFGMRPPVVHPAPPGTFAGWMKRRGKLGGQNKVPRVIADPALLDDLKAFAGFTGSGRAP